MLDLAGLLSFVSKGIYVQNAPYTSSFKPFAYDSWADLWIDNNILKWSDLGMCRACGISRARHGAHVRASGNAHNWIISRKMGINFFNKLFIVPLCRECNGKRETLRPFRVWSYDLVEIAYRQKIYPTKNIQDRRFFKLFPYKKNTVYQKKLP